MISCSDFLKEVGNYLDGDVAEEVRKHLEAHLAHCKNCTVVCDSVGKTIRVLSDSGSFELSDEAFQPLADGIMEKIRRRGQDE